ncbi:DUF3035 domain-containing protein [Roseobacter sp.]|uniref:DUF3035 domain-containing protein n=1 Tax=Roseobacter sp. TaxID=1907202 RepID=UPI0032985540
MRRALALIVITAFVGACSNTGLRDLQSNSRGPDEFIVEPREPLQTPDDLRSLPTPTPGQTNLTDSNPVADAVIALGGRPSEATEVPATDGALVTAASRFGVTATIREDLAEADEKFRRRQGRFTQFKLFPEDRYLQAYQRQQLDATATADQWRRAGVSTPSYPTN